MQVDTYYAAPHRDFAGTDEALRIRMEGPSDLEEGRNPKGTADQSRNAPSAGWEHRLTYKGPRADAASKTRVEHETAFDDPEALDAALRALGFRPAAVVRKRRTEYALGEYVVALDDVEGLGTFVEVEAAASTEDRARRTREARDVLDTLDLGADDQIRASYLELLRKAPGDHPYEGGSP